MGRANTSCLSPTPGELLLFPAILPAILTAKQLSQLPSRLSLTHPPIRYIWVALGVLGALMVAQQGLRNSGMARAADSSVATVVYAEVHAFMFILLHKTFIGVFCSLTFPLSLEGGLCVHLGRDISQSQPHTRRGHGGCGHCVRGLRCCGGSCDGGEAESGKCGCRGKGDLRKRKHIRPACRALQAYVALLRARRRSQSYRTSLNPAGHGGAGRIAPQNNTSGLTGS